GRNHVRGALDGRRSETSHGGSARASDFGRGSRSRRGRNPDTAAVRGRAAERVSAAQGLRGRRSPPDTEATSWPSPPAFHPRGRMLNHLGVRHHEERSAYIAISSRNDREDTACQIRSSFPPVAARPRSFAEDKPSPSSTPTVSRSSTPGLFTATICVNSCRWSTVAPLIIT